MPARELLTYVLGVLERSEDPVAVHKKFATVSLHQILEGVAITLGHAPFSRPIGRHPLFRSHAFETKDTIGVHIHR